MFDKPLLASIALFSAALFLAPAAASPGAMQRIEIKEWTVPWPQSRPRDPDVAPSGKIWFVGQVGHYLASLDPQTGAFTKVDLEEGAGPHNCIVDNAGKVWFAGNLTAYIGRYDPATNSIERIAMPNPAARDPHTLVFDVDQSHIWFTVQGGNFIGQLTIATRKVDLVAVPTAAARPYGIILDQSGMVWAVLFGTNKIASVDPKTLVLTEHVIPRPEARPRRIGLTSDGRIWYGDHAKGVLGAYDPKTRVFEEWAMPGGQGSKPYALVSDSKDRIWLVETGIKPNHLVGFDPQAKRFFSSTAIGSGGGSVRHMVFDKNANAIWFGTDANTIGRAGLPQ